MISAKWISILQDKIIVCSGEFALLSMDWETIICGHKKDQVSLPRSIISSLRHPQMLKWRQQDLFDICVLVSVSRTDVLGYDVIE